MSYGCGTLANPEGFATGTLRAASSNGRQHTISESVLQGELLSLSKDFQSQSQDSAALSETAKRSPGGSGGILGASGEYWNIDSNIRVWGQHEVRRNGAAAGHSVHRHDQIRRMVIPPHPGDSRQKEPKTCYSGVVSADSGYLEAWGFDLGQRDREGRPVGQWRPANSSNQFRSLRSYERNKPRMAEQFRTLRRVASVPADAAQDESLEGSTSRRPSTMAKPSLLASTQLTLKFKPDAADIGGEAGEGSTALDQQGLQFGSRSCNYWDEYGHATKREGARTTHSVHGPAMVKSHNLEGIPIIDLEMRPGAIYTKKYRDALQAEQ